MSRRPLVPRDLFAVRWLSDVQVSPDGTRAACVETRLDEALDGLRSQILLLDVERGGVVGSPSPDDASDHAPRWSPDGSRLAFVGVRGDASRLFLIDRDGGSDTSMPGAPDGVGEAAWSPDGSHLALSVSTPIPQSHDVLIDVTDDHYKRDGNPVGVGRASSAIWVVPAGGGGGMALTSGRATDRRPAWSPDGATVAFLSDRGLEGRATQVANVWRVDPTGGGRGPEPPAQVTDSSGPVTAFCWSPDAARIAVLGHGLGEATGIGWRLRIVDANGRGRPTTEVRLADDPPFALGLTTRSDDSRGMGDATMCWLDDADGGRIWTRWADGGRGALGWIALDGRWRMVIGGDRAVLSWSLAPAADRLAFIASDADDPGEVTIATLEGVDERVASRQNEDWRALVDLGTTEVVAATGPGGLPVEAWLTRPPASVSAPVPCPVIVSVHGGPHYSVGARFSFETHRLAALGYAVLSPDPRGSMGYGDAFGSAVIGDWGGDDLADILATVDMVAGSRGLDEERLAITGVSYGGYMTLWAITQDDRFRAAISENGISDLVSAFGTGEDGGTSFLVEMGGAPWERPAAWTDRSPIRYADRITTPLLLLHAELDQNCTIGQSEEMYTSLRILGRDVEFVRVPGEGHLMDLVGSARFRMARMARTAEFLAVQLAV